jgi:anthranilate synthase
MAVEHVALPLAAVQFHPESILTLDGDLGLALIRNVVAMAGAPRPASVPSTS